MNDNDLPTNLGGLAGPPVVLLLQATGANADERAVNELTFTGSSSRLTPLVRNPNGMPVNSYERWVRLRIPPPSGRISDLRVWIPDAALGPDWTVLAGTTDAYRQPTAANSHVAFDTAPDAAPGLELPVTEDRFGHTSDWLVLQAQWTPESIVTFAPPPLHLHLSWQED